MNFDDNEGLEQIFGGSEGVKGIPRTKKRVRKWGESNGQEI